MKNLTPLTDGQRADLKKALMSRLENRNTRISDLAQLHLSPHEVSTCAETFAPDAPPEEVWECYNAARETAMRTCQRTRERTEELERLELDEASAGDPRLAENPAAPPLKQLLVTLRAKKSDCDKARERREQEMVENGNGHKDAYCDDHTLNGIARVERTMDEMIAEVAALLDEECHIAENGEEVL